MCSFQQLQINAKLLRYDNYEKSWTFSEYFSSAPTEDFKIGEHGGELRTRCILCENPITLYTCAPLIKDKQMLLAEILYDHCPGILVLIFPPPLVSLSLLLTSIFTLMSCSFLPLLSGNRDLYLGTLCHLFPLFL